MQRPIGNSLASVSESIRRGDRVRPLMQVVVSLVLLGVGILILTAPNFAFAAPPAENIQNLAAGWIGAVIGYWLA